MLVSPENKIQISYNWVLSIVPFLPNDCLSWLRSCISRNLWSCVSQQGFVPNSQLNIDKCAFYVSKPKIWNQLSIMVKSTATLEHFTQKTKIALVWNHIATLNHAVMMTFARPHPCLCRMILVYSARCKH